MKLNLPKWTCLFVTMAALIIGAGCTTVSPNVYEQNVQQSKVYPPIMLTTNADASIQGLTKKINLSNTLNFGIGSKDIDPQIVTDGIRNILLEKFPQSSNGKLRLIFDFSYKLAWHSGGITTVALTGTFKDGSKTIATVTGEGSGTMPYPAFSFGFHDAATAAFAAFANNLDDKEAFVPYRWPERSATHTMVASSSQPTKVYPPSSGSAGITVTPKSVTPLSPTNAPSTPANVPPPNFNAPLPGP